MLRETILENPFGTEYFYWIDAGATKGRERFYDQLCPCSIALKNRVVLYTDMVQLFRDMTDMGDGYFDLKVSPEPFIRDLVAKHGNEDERKTFSDSYAAGVAFNTGGMQFSFPLNPILRRYFRNTQSAGVGGADHDNSGVIQSAHQGHENKKHETIPLTSRNFFRDRVESFFSWDAKTSAFIKDHWTLPSGDSFGGHGKALLRFGEAFRT